jgi:hypothetical protein
MVLTLADAFDDSRLSAVERENQSRWKLTWPELKLLFIASSACGRVSHLITLTDDDLQLVSSSMHTICSTLTWWS